MLYLLLAIVAGVGIALLLKWSEGRIQSRVALMACGYVVASLLTGGQWLVGGGAAPAWSTVGWGVLTGATFAVGLLQWMVVIGQVGVGMATTAMRLSVVLPTAASLLLFHERPAPLQVLGMGLALLAMGLVARAGRSHRALRGWRGAAGLLAFFAVTGCNAILLKVFAAVGAPRDQGIFLLLVFASAGALCWLLLALRGQRPSLPDAVLGAIFGIGNGLANIFLLRALRLVPGVIAFPIRDTGLILLVSLGGALLWQERPGPWGTAALVLAAAAVLLLGLGA